MSDAVLVFADVVASSRGLVRGIAMRVLKNDADADDAAQDAFVRVHAALASLRDERALPAWIARIAHRAAVDHLRSRIRDERFAGTGVDGDDVAAPSAANPEDLAQAAEREADVRRAVDALPDEMRCVVELKAQGLTAREIGVALALPVGTVESRLHRAKLRLLATAGAR